MPVCLCILTLTHNAPHTHCYTYIFIHVAHGHTASPHYVTTSSQTYSHTNLPERSSLVTFSNEVRMRSASSRDTRIATSAETDGLSGLQTRKEEGRMRRASTHRWRSHMVAATMQSILALCTSASKVRNKEEPRRARLPLSYTRRSKVLLVRALTLWEQGTAALDTEHRSNSRCSKKEKKKYMGVNAACRKRVT